MRVTAVDPELQPLLEHGTLTEGLTSSGFGLVPAGREPPSRRVAHPDAAAQRKREQRRRAARERVEAAEAALAEARTRAEAAQRDLERATKDLERARRAVDDVA